MAATENIDRRKPCPIPAEQTKHKSEFDSIKKVNLETVTKKGNSHAPLDRSLLLSSIFSNVSKFSPYTYCHTP